MSAINREDALNAFRDCYTIHGSEGSWVDIKEVAKKIESLPDADDGWISCEDRLPEENHWLGGSGKQFSDNVLVSVINRDDEDEWVDISQTIDGNWTLELPRYCKIIAWMPLPKPYQPKEKNDEG